MPIAVNLTSMEISSGAQRKGYLTDGAIAGSDRYMSRLNVNTNSAPPRLAD